MVSDDMGGSQLVDEDRRCELQAAASTHPRTSAPRLAHEVVEDSFDDESSEDSISSLSLLPRALVNSDAAVPSSPPGRTCDSHS